MTNQYEVNHLDTNPSPDNNGTPGEPMETNETADLDGKTELEIQATNVKFVTPIQESVTNGDTMPQDAIDPCRSEATFQYQIHNVSRMKDQMLSPATPVRNLPWKILAMQRTAQTPERVSAKTLGFFLQCNAESDSLSWSCNASAELRMLKQVPADGDSEPFVRRIQHLFFHKENDWGFSNFMFINEILDPSKGYIKDDSIILEVYVTADAPHGVSWDSKKHTGYVGLKNQGATCYMNSLLQTLYFTNKLRRAVYQMPVEHDNDEDTMSVAFALQRVFYDLQFNDKPVGTKRLTKSFGWETLDVFMQHDVQELCRVLLDNMESKMKKTVVEGTIPQLFEGKMLSYIKCKSVEYVSTREETFYDIQLNIKGKKTVIESFDDYIAKETLEGDNKYDAGDHGLQDAEKGVIFTQFPPVLHLQLMRFQYDPLTDANVKINDRFEFSEEIDLSKYLQKPEATPAIYRLHAVLVHSGDNHGGHYVGYIDPVGDRNWCKFDDDVVSKCTTKEAIDRNFGGHDDDISAKHSTNAYMLVYVRVSALDDVLKPIEQTDIPNTLIERVEQEKTEEAQKRKDRSEAHLYMYINVLLEDVFYSHHGHDLFDHEKSQDFIRRFKIRKADTVSQVIQTFADSLNQRPSALRIWPFQYRQNQTFRPTMLETPSSEFGLKTIHEAADSDSPWFIFLEALSPDSKLEALPHFDRTGHVCLFIKRYDPKSETLSYCGHCCFQITISLNDMMPILAKVAGFPEGTKLLMYEEVKPNLIDKIEFTDGLLEKELDELMDGDILIVQREEPVEIEYKKPTPKEYSRELYYQVEVVFCDKNDPLDNGFALSLSLKNNYNVIATKVAEHLGTDPYLLQFFRYKEGIGHAIRCTYEGQLKDLIPPTRTANNTRQQRKLYYQKLSIPITELENKRQFKCTWVSQRGKEERELVLHPNKTGTVQELLDEARRHVDLNPAGSGRLRLLEVASSRIQYIYSDDAPIDSIMMSGNKYLRLEEIPLEETSLSDSEMLVPVAHFHQDIYPLFGFPFLIRIVDGELFSSLRERIRKKLDVPEKDYEKYKFCIVTDGRKMYIDNVEDSIVRLSGFKSTSSVGSRMNRPYLGLDHVNKAPKRVRPSYLEKAIKIHN
ncbi:ubiquitin carboxyl-terminal hydrolase 7-like isoform X2 [Watersipora subatra]|uniref:ubiquitin carboxyl-terminal hydrolase 7-like isoform X2 n=1 Tax=Watersipora subatra TaxID=2589382 RepID=UPI00355C831B